MVKNANEFENGCIPMHCGARVVINASDILVGARISILAT